MIKSIADQFPGEWNPQKHTEPFLGDPENPNRTRACNCSFSNLMPKLEIKS